MSTERDELAELIQDVGEYIPGSHADDYISPDKAADAILAAGYAKAERVWDEGAAAALDALNKQINREPYKLVNPYRVD